MQYDAQIERFLDAIKSDAELKRVQIEAQEEEHIAAELEKVEIDMLNEAYFMIQHEVALIRSGIGRELSAKQQQNRVELLKKREEISNKVFALAKEKIAEFSGSDKYADFIVAVSNEASQTLCSDCTIFVREADMIFADKIVSAVGRCKVVADNTISLGGIKAQDASGKVVVDNTLDTRLNSQQAWFISNCNLSV